MKKLLSLGLLLSLSATAVLGQASGGGAQHTALQFLSGGGNLFVTNGGSYTNFGTSTIYLNSTGTSNITSGAAYFTNTIVQPSGTTVSNILYYPPASHDVKGWADVNGDVAPLTVSVIINNTNYMPQPNQVAFPGTNFPGLYTLPNSSNTQSLTIYLQKVLWGTNADNSTTNQFSFVVGCNGTNQVVYSTNLPTVFVQGAIGFRFAGVGSTTNANTVGNTINTVTITGFAP